MPPPLSLSRPSVRHSRPLSPQAGKVRVRAKPSAVADIGVDDDIPTRTMLIGTVIVIGAGIFIIWREHKLGLERRGARKHLTPQG